MKKITIISNLVIVLMLNSPSLLAADIQHTVKTGDSLSSIAKQYYGDNNQYMAIYEANKTLMKTPSDLQAGWTLTIPNASVETAETLPKSTAPAAAMSKDIAAETITAVEKTAEVATKEAAPIDTKAAINAAIEANKKAAKLNYEWRDAKKLIAKAQAAADADDTETALKLAKIAEKQGEAAQIQAEDQKTAAPHF